MIKVTPKNRQSLADIALQTAGSLEAIVLLSLRNNLPLSENLEVNELETIDPVDKVIFNRYHTRGVCPATEVTPEDMSTVPFGGIGFMGIEIDFIIS